MRKRKIIVPETKKVYQITLGYCYDLDNEIEEDFNFTRKNVLAIDVYDALNKASEWILTEEKKANKDDAGVFVQEVEYIDSVNIE